MSGTVGVAPATSTIYLYNPYGTVADMRGMSGSAGLGLINPGDSWLIDRKWGNPGTSTIMQRPDGSWGLRGFGELSWWDRQSGATRGGIIFGSIGLAVGLVAGILAGRKMRRSR